MPGTSVVLVTGASGFVGAAVVLELIKQGYKVKAAVRSQAKGDAFTKKYPDTQPHVEWTVVKDITVPGAFDQALEGVDYIIHAASPFHFNVIDNERDMLKPALEGTKTIFNAALKHPSIKAFVQVSSFAAIVDGTKGNREGYTYSEKDWNPGTYEAAAKAPFSMWVYTVSKKLAEQALWQLTEEYKPHFSVTSINPPMIYGPPYQVVESMDKLNTSTLDIWTLMNGSTKEPPPAHVPVYTDVRDVAHLLVASLTNAKARNQRYQAIAGHFSYNQIASIIAKNFPSLGDKVTPSDGAPPPPHYATDSSKTEKDFGIHWISLEKSVTDTVEALIKLEEELKSSA